MRRYKELLAAGSNGILVLSRCLRPHGADKAGGSARPCPARNRRSRSVLTRLWDLRRFAIHVANWAEARVVWYSRSSAATTPCEVHASRGSMSASRPPSAPLSQGAGHTSAGCSRTFQHKQLPVLNAGASHGSGARRRRWIRRDLDRGCRELLGDEADGLSDHEVDLIRQHADAMAHIIVEMFLENSTTLE